MKDRLTEIGFEVLDYIYGELTIKKGRYFDEAFVDKDGKGRLGYDNRGRKKESYLGFYYKDLELFLIMVPVEYTYYRTVLEAWMLERYKRECYRVSEYNNSGYFEPKKTFKVKWGG